jgi:hypothetical protein
LKSSKIKKLVGTKSLVLLLGSLTKIISRSPCTIMLAQFAKRRCYQSSMVTGVKTAKNPTTPQTQATISPSE